METKILNLIERLFETNQPNLAKKLFASLPEFWKQNYDYGKGFYHNLDKLKSVKDFLQKKKKKKTKT